MDLSTHDLEIMKILKVCIENIPLIIICEDDLIIKENDIINKVYKKFLKPINYKEIMKKLNEISVNKKAVSATKMTVTKILLNLGFNINSIGTKYLIESIVFFKEDTKLKNLKETYLCVAHKYLTNYMAVKWAVENSINKFNCSVNEKEIQQFFKITDNRKLTPKYVINFFKYNTEI